MSLKSAMIVTAVAAMAFASSSEAFAAKKNKRDRVENNIHKQERLIKEARRDNRHFNKRDRRGRAHRGLPMRVILHSLRDRGYRRLRVRDGQLPGYKIKACKNGRKFMLGVNRWGGIKWRDRIGTCFHFRKFRDYGNSFYFRFKL